MGSLTTSKNQYQCKKESKQVTLVILFYQEYQKPDQGPATCTHLPRYPNTTVSTSVTTQVKKPHQQPPCALRKFHPSNVLGGTLYKSIQHNALLSTRNWNFSHNNYLLFTITPPMRPKYNINEPYLIPKLKTSKFPF